MDIQIFDALQDHIRMEAIIACATHSKGHYEKGYKYQYDLWIMTEGTITFNYEDRTYSLEKGDLFFMYPNVIYDATVTSDSAQFIYCRFDYSLDNVPSALDAYPLSGHIPSQIYLESELERSVNDFLRSIENHKNNAFMSGYLSKQYFGILMANLFKFRLTHASGYSAKSKEYKKLSRLIPILEILHNNPNQYYSTADLSSSIGMSEKYFITYFKDVLGLTPHKYHTQLKMQRAVTLLSEQRHTVREISESLGYSDAYNFSTAFKKHYGVSPSAYLQDGKDLSLD